MFFFIWHFQPQANWERLTTHPICGFITTRWRWKDWTNPCSVPALSTRSHHSTCVDLKTWTPSMAWLPDPLPVVVPALQPTTRSIVELLTWQLMQVCRGERRPSIDDVKSLLSSAFSVKLCKHTRKQLFIWFWPFYLKKFFFLLFCIIYLIMHGFCSVLLRLYNYLIFYFCFFFIYHFAFFFLILTSAF